MHLFPSEPQIGEDEGFTAENDPFGRREFGDRLTRIIRALEDPAVLVLDAPWGSGKTVFVKQWRGELKKLGVPSIYFDAFKNDYHEDAFLALAGEILTRARELTPKAVAAATTFKAQAVRVAKVLGRAALHVGIKAATAGIVEGEDLKGAANELAKEAGKETAKALDEILTNRLESHAEDRKAFAEFGEALSNLAVAMSPADAKSISPLVFIIDELDRCRPPFGLALLEKIKHFFSVSGVRFLLVANMPQMEAAVKYAYGHDVNARAYLEKFYHLRLTLPRRGQFGGRIEDAAYVHVVHLFNRVLPSDSDKDFSPNAVRILAATAGALDLPLRTIERIASYVGLAVASTKPNDLRLAPLIVGLSVMKVIAPELYEKARSGRLAYVDIDGFFQFSAWKGTLQNQITASREFAESCWRIAARGKVTAEDQRRLDAMSMQYSIEVNSLVPDYISLLDGLSFSNDPR